MQTRVARFSVLALLLASGIAAAVFSWHTERRVQALERERYTRESTLDRLAPVVAAIAAVQQAYANVGQKDEASFSRVSRLIEEITTDAAGLRASVEASSSEAAHLEEFWTALSALHAADTQAAQRLAAGESLAAADLILGSGRAHVMTLDMSLRAFRDVEFDGYEATRASLVRTSWLATGGVAMLWAAGLLALTPLPRRGVVPVEVAEAVPMEMPPPVAVAPPPAPATPLPETPAFPPIDLAATADLCAAISRMTEVTALPRLLARASAIVAARGMIIWMGADDELCPAASHGYDAGVLARVRPIRRSAENATAAAWRLGELRTVAGDDSSHGAIVAPMAGANGCIGVLAAEVPSGREREDGACSALAIIASQLANVLAAWPAASAPAGAAAAASDRETAAS